MSKDSWSSAFTDTLYIFLLYKFYVLVFLILSINMQY